MRAASLHYQPVFRLVTGELRAVRVVIGAERDETIGLGTRVLDTVFHQAAAWERSGIRPHVVFRASATELDSPAGAELLRNAIRRAGADRSWFTVEVADEAVATTAADARRVDLGREVRTLDPMPADAVTILLRRSPREREAAVVGAGA